MLDVAGSVGEGRDTVRKKEIRYLHRIRGKAGLPRRAGIRPAGPQSPTSINVVRLHSIIRTLSQSECRTANLPLSSNCRLVSANAPPVLPLRCLGLLKLLLVRVPTSARPFRRNSKIRSSLIAPGILFDGQPPDSQTSHCHSCLLLPWAHDGCGEK